MAVYPGSFDPLTNGHVDIILRGARLFDRIIVAILRNAEKHAAVHARRSAWRWRARCSASTRTSRSRRSTACWSTTPQRKQASAIVRGLRAVSDFEFELQMALMNRRLGPDIETVFMMPAEQYTYVSSRLIKEVFALGGPVAGPGARRWWRQRLREKRAEN